ncbi:tail fiber protein [Chryseobacterium sp.]|uniref:tail fiber protein n=1 Tax=Chryseobacterium sp. TaxID=1871047 RepID=UPI0012A8ECF4|nr:tail fiber protein [Chryseobacterium sp.]QFG52720.1 hypothetical protein F7R58_03895 [Chryseobacterium sp.]
METNVNNQGTALDFEIPAFYNAFTLDNSFGGIKIGLYRSKDERNYFFTPLIIVDWNDFEIQLNEKKDEFENLDNQLELSLLIYHSDKEIEKNIESKIIAIENAKRSKDKKENITTTDISLNLLPFKFFKVYAKVGETKQWLNEDDFINITPEDNFTTQLSLISERAYVIKGTFKQLNNFFNNRRTNLIWANLYGDGSPYSTTTISAIATFFNNSQNIKKIIGDEDLIIENKIKSSSSGGGFGISLGSLSIGAGATSSVLSNEQKKKRFLNRTFISDIINENKSEISLSVDGDTTKYSELIKGFVDKLFENKQRIEVKIEITNNNLVKLFNDQIEYTMSAKESEELLKSKPVIDKSDKNKESFTYGGIKGEKDTENNFKTQDDIEWQKKGADIIPIKIDLYLISESQLKDEFSNLAILVNRESKKNSITPFLYPAVWNSKKNNYNNGSITDKDNPIGSILAFGGSRETIPLGWLLCDGAELEKSEYSDLEKILQNNWGTASSDTKFKIPNLQGQFLRGVDYDTINISDPDSDIRIANGKGQSREVGSFQNDEFKSHNHDYDTDNIPGNSNNGTGNDASNKNFKITQTTNKGGNETRPKNYYVNFIIRAQ